ncbi:MAG: nitroreductase family protein [Bacillota bacterium]|nr:nitroreductase family protein [Bacillota bacterium]
MKSLKLAEKRKSVREYKNKKLTGEDRKYLEQLVMEKPPVAADASLEFIFIEDGGKAAIDLGGELAGYYGKMIEAPHYYAVLSDSENKCYKIAGYVGEWLILNAIKKNIGTCWIEVLNSEKVKEVMNIQSEKEVVALIALGYPKKEYNLSNIYASITKGSISALTDLGYPNIDSGYLKKTVSSRKSITEFVFIDRWGNIPDIEELEMRGIHDALFYMRLAPSYKNRQPWYFIVKGNEIDLFIEQSDEISEAMKCLDAGIAMFYFEVGLHDIGIRGKWNLSEFDTSADIPNDYKIAGRYQY